MLSTDLLCTRAPKGSRKTEDHAPLQCRLIQELQQRLCVSEEACAVGGQKLAHGQLTHLDYMLSKLAE